jgi:aspartate racemase
VKTIGLIGGMSWESSADYYRIINQAVREQLGGQSSAKVLMYSLDFAELERMQVAGEWDKAAALMIAAAERLVRGGADFLLICANTMHKVAPVVQAAIPIPLIHIADATAEVVCAAGIQRIGLLGTRYTMEHDFYKGKLIAQYGLDVLVPNEADRTIIHNVIYGELCVGKIEEASRAEYLRIMNDLVSRGAEAVILGCTEIGMLIKPEHTQIRLFDTTIIHAETAVRLALQS